MLTVACATFYARVYKLRLLQTAGWTALFFAVKEGYMEIAEKLIAAGANIHITDRVLDSS